MSPTQVTSLTVFSKTFGTISSHYFTDKLRNVMRPNCNFCLSSSMGSGLSSMGSGYMVLILLCVERVHCIHVVRRMIH